MGPCGGCQKAEALSSPNNIQSTLQKALNLRGYQVGNDNKETLSTFIAKGSNMMDWSGQTTILLDHQKMIELVKRVSIELHQNIIQVSIQEQTNENNLQGEREDLIVYEEGFYWGASSEGKPHGSGTLYFSAENASDVSVRGQWVEGSVKNVWIYKGSLPLLKLQMLGSKTAQLIFPSKQIGYRGSISLPQLKQVTSLSSIMTGVGSLHFTSSGDEYQGRVQNGLMHTEEGELGKYTSQSTQTVYKGPFRNGKRHGKGTLLVKIPHSLRQAQFQTDSLSIQVTYEEGRLVESSDRLLCPLGQ